MKPKHFTILSILVFLAVVICRQLEGTGAGRLPETKPVGGQPPALWYLAAVVDASNVLASKVSTNLIPITVSNTNLAWRTNNGSLQVKVVTFQTKAVVEKFYSNGPGMFTNSTQWVTVYPYLKRFCEGIPDKNKLLRIKQVLGLPPWNANDTIAEFWVSPDYLFRPTPEPLISTTTAGLSTSTNAPLITGNWRLPLFWPDWYSNNWTRCNYGLDNSQGREIANASPFTQLGYTYDWGSPARNHEGLSEFIIPSGAIFATNGKGVPIVAETNVSALSYGD